MSVYPDTPLLRRSARVSADGLYRYSLLRRWDHGFGCRPIAFLMLNPSTADGELDDPTIRRCVGFARALGGAGIIVGNLYAYRATKPRDLWQADDPVGPGNDIALTGIVRTVVAHGGTLVAAWGANAKAPRVEAVRELVAREGAELTALGVTAAGAPRHPLYLPADARPSRWPAT